MKQFVGLIIALFSFFAFNQITFAITDSEITQRIILESIQSYPGNCPCPYNYTRNGSRCGGRSAYSRAGGYSPICYPEDVTPEMIRDYKMRHKI